MYVKPMSELCLIVNVVIMFMYDYVSAYKRTNVGEQSGARFTLKPSSKPTGFGSLVMVRQSEMPM